MALINQHSWAQVVSTESSKRPRWFLYIKHKSTVAVLPRFPSAPEEGGGKGSPTPSTLRPEGGRGQGQSYPLSPPPRRRAGARAVLPPFPSAPEEGGGKGSPSPFPLRPGGGWGQGQSYRLSPPPRFLRTRFKDLVTPLIYNEELRPKVPANENSRIALTNNLDFYNKYYYTSDSLSKSDWSRAFNQFTIACELDMINAISAADIAFIMSSSTSAWLLSPLECSPQKQNG